MKGRKGDPDAPFRPFPLSPFRPARNIPTDWNHLMKPELPLLALVLVLLATSLKAMDFPKHPFVMLDQKELATVRAEVSKQGWKHDIYHKIASRDAVTIGKALRPNADFWLQEKITIPPYGGHSHNFFCDDGAPLVASPEHTYHPGPFRCPSCGREYTAEKYIASQALKVHHLLSQAALDLALVSAIEQKPEYSAKASEILLKYSDAYPGPHTTHVSGGMMLQSLDEAVWVIRLAKAYDLIYNDLTADQRVRIEKFLHTVADGLIKCSGAGNWSSWHSSATGVIGYATDDEKLAAWAIDFIKSQMARELPDDCIWPESIHTYHYYVLQAFTHLAEAARHTGVDLYSWEPKPGKSMLKMLTVPLDHLYPDMRIPAINDGWFNSYPPSELYEIAYRQTGDPRFAWVLSRGYPKNLALMEAKQDKRSVRASRYALFFGEELPDDIAKPSLHSVDFPVLGICALRSPDDTAVLTFHHGPFVGHGHPDKMAITLFADGKLWAADYGTQGYGSPSLRWFRSGYAHNMIIVDGKPPAATKERNADIWLGDPDMEGARSTTQEAYPGVTWTRTVIRVGDYFVVRDQLDSKESHAYDFYLHSEGRLTMNGLQGGGKKAEPATPWIKDLRAWGAAGTLSGHWTLGISALDIRMLGSGPITPMVGKCPSETAARTIPLLIARQSGASAEFITVLYPRHTDADLTINRNGDKLVITHGTSEDVLLFSRIEGRPSVARRTAQ